MKPFSDIWPFTDTIPGSFTLLSAEKLYEVACAIPTFGVVVEIGVDQGRSASVLMAAGDQTASDIYLFDSWESVLVDNYARVKEMLTHFNRAPFVTRMSSTEAAYWWSIGPPIDLLHIDANHYAPHPAEDCEAWLPKLCRGGIACFHDYGAPGFDVTAAVDHYTAGWEDLGVWDSLAIRRKP